MTMSDEKYVVFKKEEFDKFLASMHERGAGHLPVAIEDAVVIRRQDVFAPAALEMYASSIAIVASLMEEGEDRDDLIKIADYFYDQSQAAWDADRKVPD